MIPQETSKERGEEEKLNISDWKRNQIEHLFALKANREREETSGASSFYSVKK